MKRLLLVCLLLCAAATAQIGTGAAGIGPLPTSSATVALPFVTPEAYDAKGDGKFVFDGVVTPPSMPANSAAGSGTTATTPSVTTPANNALVVYAFLGNASYSGAPTPGTNRVLQTFSSGNYALAVNDQILATAGAASGTATLGSSVAWVASAISLAPASGSSISLVASSNIQTASTSTVTVSKPAGTAAGNMLIACVDWYSHSMTAPAGWVQLTTATDSGSDIQACYYKMAGTSEPASYTWTQSGSSGMAAAVLAYAGADHASGLTSASAGFTSADVGKAVCTAGTSAGGTQQCGTISAYTSPTAVDVSYPAGQSASSDAFVYGTDDTAAFNSMLTTAPCATLGCHAALSMKMYVLTSSLTLPNDRIVQIAGQGYGLANTENSFLNGNTAPNADMGTRLDWATTSLSGPAMLLGGVSHVTSTTAFDRIADFAMYAGAGRNRDGGGSDGLSIRNWQGFEADRIAVVNFSGRGVYIDGVTDSSYQDYLEQLYFSGDYFLWNGGAGFAIGTPTTYVNNIETTAVYDSVAENNGGPGIDLEGKAIQGFTLRNSVIQWNNVAASAPELKINYTSGANAPSGCNLISNYFEADTNGGSQSSSWITANAVGCNVINNFVAGNAASGLTGINTTSPTTALTVNGTATVSALANGCSGTTTLAAGTVTVSNACITGSRPMLAVEQTTGTPNALGVIQAAGSLTIKSSNASDTSAVYWSQQ